MVTRTDPNPSQDPVRVLLKSKEFLNWKPGRPLRLEELNPRFSAMDEHFSPQQLADAWGVSTETIRQIFRNEQGVLKIGKPGTKVRRGYFTLRIPKEVAERVHRRLSA